jgi:hypothetical protein
MAVLSSCEGAGAQGVDEVEGDGTVASGVASNAAEACVEAGSWVEIWP